MAVKHFEGEQNPLLLDLNNKLRQTNPTLYRLIKEEMSAIRKLVFETVAVETDLKGSYLTDIEHKHLLRSNSIAEIDLSIEFHQFEKDQKHAFEKHVTTVCLVDKTAPKVFRRKELHIKLLRVRVPKDDPRFVEGNVHCQLKILKSHEDKQKTVGETECIEARDEETLRWNHIFVIQAVTMESLANAFITLHFQERIKQNIFGRHQFREVGRVNLSDKDMVHSRTGESAKLHSIMAEAGGVDVSLPLRYGEAVSGGDINANWKKTCMKRRSALPGTPS